MIYIVDELYLENSNTFQAAKEIIRKYPARYIQVVADETGNRRRTSANQTDHEIIKRSGLDLLKFRNPSVKDRYNNMNRLLERGYIKIHPRCKKLIRDLIKSVVELWEYGIHEKTFKFFTNFGIINRKIDLIDFFEITDNLEKVEKQIKERKWHKPERLKESLKTKKLVTYFIKEADKKLNIENLRKLWKKRLK